MGALCEEGAKYTRTARIQIHQLCRINHTPSTHGQKRIRPRSPKLRLTKRNRLLDTRILRLDPRLRINHILNALSVQCLPRELHCIQLLDRGICDDAHLLGTHVGKVHADFFGAAGAEADVGRSHLEGIFFLGGVGDGGGKVAACLVCGGEVVVVMRGVGVAWTVWRMSVLDCACGGVRSDETIVRGMVGHIMELTEEVERSCSPCGCDTDGCHNQGM